MEALRQGPWPCFWPSLKWPLRAPRVCAHERGPSRSCPSKGSEGVGRSPAPTPRASRHAAAPPLRVPQRPRGSPHHHEGQGSLRVRGVPRFHITLARRSAANPTNSVSVCCLFGVCFQMFGGADAKIGKQGQISHASLCFFSYYPFRFRLVPFFPLPSFSPLLLFKHAV